MPEGLHLGAAIRSAPRAAEVAAALTRFGFGTLLREVGLERFVSRGTEATGDGQRPTPVRVRLMLQSLGSTFIKLGQIASTRADLLPPDWIAELRKLQNKVPPDPWEGDRGIAAHLREQYGDNLEIFFEHIDQEALAGASIAQTHRAKLSTGEDVVLKILRPGIRERLNADIQLMRLLVRPVRAHIEAMGFDPDSVIDEFSRQLHRETDLLLEARSMARMGADFADNPSVCFPKVYRELSTTSVLVMEEIKGRLLSDLDTATLDKATRETIIRNGADAVFRQCLQIGFFHADPHPGNIFVLEEGRICFVDCGMTGLIEPRTLGQLADITWGAINGDLDRVVRVAIDLAGADPAMAEDRAFRSAAWHFIDRFKEGTLRSIRMGQLLDEFFTVLRRFHLRCPADVIYLIKALTTIEAVASSIAPDFDLVSYVHPYADRLVRERHGLRAVKDRAEKALFRYIDLIEQMPEELGGLVRSIRRNSISVQLDHKGLDELTDEVERASMNISWSLGIAAVIVGSAILVLADNIDRQSSALTVIATVGFIIAIVAAMFRMLSSWLHSRRH